MIIRVRRGLEANRTSYTPQVGEPTFTTDTKKLYIGDGVTPGGILVDLSGGGIVQTIVAGTNVTVDNTDPANPIVSAVGGGEGAVESVNGQTGEVVLDSDDISDAGATKKFATAAEKTKLGFIAVTQAVDLDALESGLASHIANVSNPHSVTKAQVGLSNVPNTDFTAAVAANTAKNSYPSGDAAKLAGIEDNADVTDAANVAAAGALMESELLFPDDVKAFEAADFATADQGLLADTAVQPVELGAAAFSNDYNDLSNKPAIPDSVDDLSPSQTGNSGKFLKTDGSNATWEAIPGGGDMLASTYDPQAIAADAFDQDNMTDGTTNKNYTATEKTKLADIEAYIDSVIAVAWLTALPVGATWNGGENPDNPSTYLPGHSGTTWVADSEGQVQVGLDSGDTDFDTAGETGGAKTHTLTVTEMPSHTHTPRATSTASNNTDPVGRVPAGNSPVRAPSGLTLGNTGVTTSSTGGDGAHNNLQPYIVKYMWKRTA